MNTPDMVTHGRSAGFSLIEFMIAITVSLVILSALSAMFVANSRARLEIERANQQIENGRYAVMALTDDLQLAGYLSHYNLTEATTAGYLPVPAAKPAPCLTTAAALSAALPLHVLGYDNTGVACLDGGGDDLLADYKAGTDVLVVRRVSTCIRGSANCPDVPGAPYFQASLCATQLNVAGGAGRFRLDTSIANLNRTLRNCTGLAPIRQVLIHVYFVTNNDQLGGSDARDCDGDGVTDGDCIPTLKRAELTAEGGVVQYKAYSIANGIEDLQLEYGLDTDATPDGDPDVFTAAPDLYDPDIPGTPAGSCAANPDCTGNWFNVVSIKASLLARNPGESRDHVDTKIYTLGLNAAGVPQCAKDDDADGGCEAFGDAYKRHVYQSAIRLNNAAGRRE